MLAPWHSWQKSKEVLSVVLACLAKTIGLFVSTTALVYHKLSHEVSQTERWLVSRLN